MAFIASYRGRCADCQGDIIPGQEIARIGRTRRYRHTECAEHLTYKQQHGRCEDAPCCGCCGGWQEAESSYFVIGAY